MRAHGANDLIVRSLLGLGALMSAACLSAQPGPPPAEAP